MRKGTLARPERKKFLAETTKKMAGLALANNYE